MSRIQQTVKLSQDLIRFPSVERGQINKCMQFCKEWLESHGLKVNELKHDGYSILTTEIGQGKKRIILNGHVDVVKGKPEQYNPYIEGGRLYGRGANDMKAALASFMVLVSELKGRPLPCKVQLQIVPDEETGGSGSKYLADQGYHGDLVIAGESTDLRLGVQAKGILQIDIKVTGRSAHGSRPWQGENAILKAVELYSLITSLPFTNESSELYEGPSVNLSFLNGGDAYNKVPDECVMGLDIRYLAHQTSAQILGEIKSVVGDNVTVKSEGDAVTTSPYDPFIIKLKSSAEKVLKKEAVIFGQHGSADTRFYSKYGIPALEFGPCGRDHHGDNEYVVIDSLDKFMDIIEDLIYSMKN
jgi:succinyl-diaminopimelate desuccinylase